MLSTIVILNTFSAPGLTTRVSLVLFRWVPGVFVISILPGFFRAAVAAMALYNPGSGISGHDQQMMGLPGGFSSERAVVCFVCHRCMAKSTKANPSLWDPHLDSNGDQCSIQRRAGNVSLLCLSCHDGAIAPIPPTSKNWFAGQRTLGVPQSEWSRNNKIGHHPYWVAYPVVGNPIFLPIGENPACPLPLFNSSRRGGSRVSVECPTCHDVHSPAAGSYLRVPKKQFELCLCCHRELPALSREVYLPMQKEKVVIENGECRSCHDK